jgi:hypothetical protein
MREGDLYPELRSAQIEPWTMIQREWPELTAANWTTQDPLAAVNIREYQTPAVRVTIPAVDWEVIMQIYRAHYHAESRHPSVRAAWEQYKIMCSLTR